MSDPVSALGNVSYADGIARVSEIGPMGMITLRGDLSAKSVQKAVKAATGFAVPDQRQCHSEGARGVAWMSPDELLVMCDYADAHATAAQLAKALAGEHALVANVSDARAVFQVAGPHARDVLGKLMPVDLDPAVFTRGMFRRTRMAQVAAAFWMPEDEVFQVVCFRSVGQYVFDLLKITAQPGSEVGHFGPDAQ